MGSGGEELGVGGLGLRQFGFQGRRIATAVRSPSTRSVFARTKVTLRK